MKTILRQTPGAVINGLIYFRLGLWVGATEVAHWAVNSGQPGAQTLRTYEDPKSLPGNMEPIPEGVYPLSGPYWAGSPEDYDHWWSSALGPVVWDLHCKGDTKKGYRGDLRIHLDANRSSAPGSAGCPVHLTMDALIDFVAACSKHKPAEFVADYGLGTVPGAPGKSNGKPTVEAKTASAPTASVTLDGSPLGRVPIVDGQTLATVPLVAQLLGFSATWDAAKKNVALEPRK